MYNNDIHNTYNRLHNGDEQYLKVLGQIAEYKVTNGRKESQVKIYLNPKQTIVRFIIYIFLIVSAAIGIAILSSGLNNSIYSDILSTIPFFIFAYAAYQIINIEKYQKLAKVYLDINEFIKTIDPRLLTDIYTNYKNSSLY